MPAVVPPKVPKSAATMSAASFYSQQNSTFKSKPKSKKKKNALSGIQKFFNSKSSKAVSHSILQYVDKNSIGKKKSSASGSLITASKPSVLAKPDHSKSIKLDVADVVQKMPKSILKSHDLKVKPPTIQKVISKPKIHEENLPQQPNSKKLKKDLKGKNAVEIFDANIKKVPLKKVKNAASKLSVANGKGDCQVSPQKLNTKSSNKEIETSKQLFEKILSRKSNGIEKILDGLEYFEDTKLRGLSVLGYLLFPLNVSEFFDTYWEKKHLLIKRKTSNYMNGLFSTQDFDDIMRHQYVEFTKNLDVTSYSDGERQTHNPAGRAYPPVVWDYFSNGCSLRMLNPQTFHYPVWQVLAAMQDYMGSFCGANIYLTPAETQGFAPHWDDIEAFIIQLEGKKRWRVYKPRNKSEMLPRFSSTNLSQNEIGTPILDVILEKGDLLYFPRGYIHQAEAVVDTHSLHITISSYQKNAWVDLLEKILTPKSLALASATSCSLREGLPRGCFEYMGVMADFSKNSNTEKRKRTNSSVVKKRKDFKETVVSLIQQHVLTDAVIDQAVDAMAQQFVRVALPLPLTDDEKCRTVVGDGERWGPKGVEGRVEVEPQTRIRLLGALSTRAVQCGDEWRLYHTSENSREYEGREEQFIVLEEKHLPTIHLLQSSYPGYTSVESFPLLDLEDKMSLAMALWEHNLVITEDPLECDDDFDDSDSS